MQPDAWRMRGVLLQRSACEAPLVHTGGLWPMEKEARWMNRRRQLLLTPIEGFGSSGPIFRSGSPPSPGPAKARRSRRGLFFRALLSLVSVGRPKSASFFRSFVVRAFEAFSCLAASLLSWVEKRQQVLPASNQTE